MVNREQLFKNLRRQQRHYTAAKASLEAIADKHFVAAVGPSAIGKSTIMNRVSIMDPDFKWVITRTSRPPRSNDTPEMYRYIITDDDFAKLEEDIAHGELLQYAIDPTRDVLYGSYPEDYPGVYNIGDVWASAVSDFQNLGFKSMTTVYLVADANDWATWFRSRFMPGDEVAIKRLTEAEQSLEWAIGHHTEIKWLKNTAQDIDETAARFIHVSQGGDGNADGIKLAKQMLDKIHQLKIKYSFT